MGIFGHCELPDKLSDYCNIAWLKKLKRGRCGRAPSLQFPIVQLVHHLLPLAYSLNYLVTITLPKEYSSAEMFGNDEKFNPCKMYALHETGIDSENSGINGACHSESFDNGTVMACDSYVYDTSIFPETLTTSFNLVSNYFKYIPTYFSKVWVT